jgi:hypothetical protein
MRIVFVLRRPSLVRYYEPTLALLAERGHDLELVFSRVIGKGDAPPDVERADALIARYPTRISYLEAPDIDPAAGWRGIAGAVRIWGDFARFLHPRFAHAPLLRQRIAHRAKLAIRPAKVGARASRSAFWLVDRLERTRSARLSDGAAWLGRRLEEAIPPAPEIVDFIESRSPDVVVVSPLIDAGSDQVEFVKAARLLGVPSGAAIASWDNLSSKGLIRLDPDRVFVWNDIQIREAVDMHGVAEDRLVATGAPRFDPWFERRPSRGAAELADQIGLEPGHPYILYLCSSAFIAPNELPFVERWLARLRADEELRNFGVLIRPHPQNAYVWREADLSRFGNVTIWPRAGANVDDESSRADFYDSLAHSAAVVGINTSALIEAAIVGKSVFTVVDGAFAGTQSGTLHFHYLRHENGGFLRESGSLDEHVSQLRAGIREAAADADQTRSFVASFVRPRGIGLPAVPLLADEIERLAAIEAAPLPRPAATRLLSIALSGVAALRRARMRRRGPDAAPDAASAALEAALRDEAPSRRIETERQA